LEKEIPFISNKIFDILKFLCLIKEMAEDANIALMEGVRASNLDQVKTAVKNGGDVNYVETYTDTQDGIELSYSPLHVASHEGKVAIMEFLISSGADVNALGSGVNLSGTPLIWAADNGQLEAVKVLVAKGAELTKTDESSSYLTALHCATQSGHQHVASFLLEKGMDIDIEDANNETPLFKAAENGHLEVVKFLVSKKADVNHVGIVRTPLHCAADIGNLEILKFLLEKGADPNKAGSVNKETPLHIAASNGHKEIVQLLLEKGANKKLTDIEDKTPFDKASTEEIKKLLK